MPQPAQPKPPSTQSQTSPAQPGALSDDDQAQAQSIRIASYEAELREAHAHPQVDEDGNVTNVAEIMEDYGQAREERFKAQQQ